VPDSTNEGEPRSITVSTKATKTTAAARPYSNSSLAGIVYTT
jgi:hypothetical protein